METGYHWTMTIQNMTLLDRDRKLHTGKAAGDVLRTGETQLDHQIRLYTAEAPIQNL